MEAGKPLNEFPDPSPGEAELAERPQLHIVPVDVEKVDAASPSLANLFVDYEAAKAEEPEVFSAVYDDEADQPYFHAMVKDFTDPEVMARVDIDFGDKNVPRDSGSTVSDDIFQDFLNKANRYRLLTDEEQVTLGRNMKLGVAAYKKMATDGERDNETLQGLARQGVYSYQAFFCANLRLVVKPVREHSPAYKHIEDVDGLQYAYLGLQRAIEKFDETRGVRFSTYAYRWIKQALGRNIANSARIIRLPVAMDVQWRRYDKQVGELRAELGREPTLSETRQATGLSEEAIKTFETFGGRSMASLNKPVNANGAELGSMVVADDPNERRADTLAASQQLRKIINLASLTDTEKMVLSIKRGIMLPELEGSLWPGGSYEEIFDEMGVRPDHKSTGQAHSVPTRKLGEALGITAAQLRYIEDQGLKRLQIAAMKSSRPSSLT